jgi:hypothetical protein
MASQRLPRNAPCPCGSGKKYKQCCSKKGFEYLVDEDGNVLKSIPMSEGMAEMSVLNLAHGLDVGDDDF